MAFEIPVLDIKEVGIVKELKQGIVKIEGLPSCMYGELLQFPQEIDDGVSHQQDAVKGLVIGFDSKEVSAIVMSGVEKLSVGDTVNSLGDLVTVPVGEGFLGRVVDSLGKPIDGKGDIPAEAFFQVFQDAPGIMERDPIDQPILTGIKSVDLLIPIGKGQRELIIGDRQTGKTSLCMDTIINQKDKDVICIYCWIGGPRTDLKKHLYNLNQKGALDYTIVVAAPADTAAAEQYLVPYTAAAVGEYFMNKGKDVLVVFDDLTKHAWIYREMSLLLDRSPGREAYPGDIFYLHSQLLERAARLKEENGGGSMTFLPIVETLQGDITGYIQTNLVSITDGQIYINTNLFKEGFKPAIDLGLSVSRIGNKVQCPAIKEVSQGLRLEYSQYRDMVRFQKLRTRLSAEALEKMRRGETLQELLIQPNNQPVSLEEEILLFYAFKRKILAMIPKEILKKFIKEVFNHLCKEEPQLIERLGKEQDLTPDLKKEIDRVFIAFFKKLDEEMKAEAE